MAQIQIINSPNYYKLYPNYIKRIEEITKKNVKLSVVNLGTIAVFSKIWHKNLLYNFSLLWKSIPLKVFENKFNSPVVIAASGPSLTKQFDYLKKIKENQSALIIAAGSTINPLLKAGIKPHLVVSIDGGEANWKHFKNINFDDIPLFYSLAVHKDIPRHHNGFKVAFNSEDEALSAWVNKAGGKELGTVIGGASVSNFCFYIAKTISSGPITLIGQDLAYTDNHTHAVGNVNFKEVSELNYQDKNKYINIKGYYGEEVISDYQFLSMKRVFEDMVSAFRKYGEMRPIFNSTEGGAFIEGITNIEFKEFINKYCNKSYAYDFDEAFKQYEYDFKQKEQIITGLEIEQKNLEEVIYIAKKALDILSSISRQSVVVNARLLKKLDKFDEQINSYLESNIIHYITMPVNFRINHIYQEKENETPIEQTKRILDKSEALYKGILEASETTLNIIDEVLSI